MLHKTVRTFVLFTFVITLAATAIGADPSYKDAYAEAKKRDVPLVVLVGAGFCPYCRSTKATLKQMAKDGELDDVAVGLVDIDKEPRLAKQLRTSDTIPELIVFRFNAKTQKWTRRQAIGGQSAAEIRDIIAK